MILESVKKGNLGQRMRDRLRTLGFVELGEEAWEIYRIAKGLPRAGNEITGSFNPYDVGLTDFVSYTKGCYVGQEVIARLDTYQKVRRGLFGLRSTERLEGLPARLTRDGSDAGVLTSLSAYPHQGEHLGLGVLRRDVVEEGDLLSVEGSGIELRVSPIPMEITPG